MAAEDLGALRVREPHKYTIPFIRNAWFALNHRWAREIMAIANVLRLRARVDRPTYDQLESIGMTIGPLTRKTIFRKPDVSSVRADRGYFQTEIIRNDESRQGISRSAPLS